jgi:uncharacterized protein (DUF1810 family)
MSTVYNLERFLEAQARQYNDAMQEITAGRKKSHWMWFIFPQLKGLGRSSTAQFYGLAGKDEAAAYLNHPELGPRLIGISTLLLKIGTDDAHTVFGSPDDMKLRSCMTLFAGLEHTDIVFELVLKKFFGGRKDEKTLELLHLAP